MIHLLRYLSLRHALRHKVRTLLTLTGVSLGVAVVIAIQTVNHTVIESFRRMIDSIAGRTTLQIGAGSNGVPEELWEKLEHLPYVSYVTPIVQQIVRISDSNEETALLLGIDFTGDEQFRDYSFSEKIQKVDDPLAFLNDPDAVLISKRLAERFQKKEGDFLKIETPGNIRNLRIRGLLEAEGPARAFGGSFLVMDIFAAQALLQKEGKFDRYDLITKEGQQVREIQQRLLKDLNNAYMVELPRARGDSASTMLTSFQTGLNVAGFIAVLVGLFLIYNTMQISVTARRKEISIARAFGAKQNDVMKLFLGEALALGLTASLLGVIGGLGLGKGLLLSVSHVVSLHFLKVNPQGIYVSPWILLFGLVIGVLSAVIASFGPAKAASCVTPVEGLRFENSSKIFPPTWTSKNAKVSYTLLLLGSLLWFLASRFSDVLWGYAAQLSFILAFAFLAPTLLVFVWKHVKWIFHRLLKPPERLAFDQLPRNVSRVAVTLSAIMIGFAMVVEVDSYIFSLKTAVKRWILQSLPGDIFVTSGAKLARLDNRPMPEQMEQTLKSWPEVEAVDKVRIIEVDVGGVPVPLLANIPEIYLHYSPRDFIEGNRRDALARLNDESVVVVAENFLRRFHKKMGDWISIATPQGVSKLKIIGVIEDYTSDRGLLVVGRSQFLKYFNDSLVDSFNIYLKDKSKVEVIRQKILQTWSKDLELFAMTNEDMKNEAFRVIDETYTVIQVLEIVAVLVSVLGIINTILASVLERTRMLGVLRALGATRFQIARMVMAEGGYLSLGGMTLGMILGMVMTEIILTTVLPQATGWSLALKIPTLRIIGVFVSGFCLSILAAYYPARQASRLNIVKAIEYE